MTGEVIGQTGGGDGVVRGLSKYEMRNWSG